MSDIDFDELDRAVNDLMNRRNATNAGENPSVVKTSDEPKPAEVVTPEAKPAPAAESPTVRRPTGRFMDVVRPSSDMRAAQAAREAPTPQPIREAKTIDPVMQSSNSPTEPSPATTTPAPTEPASAPSFGVSTEVEVDPDSLALATMPAEPIAEDLIIPEPAEVEEPSVSAMPTAPVVNEIVLDEIQPEPVAVPEPIQSPFLNNVTVSKRPLGSMVAEEAPKETEEEATAGDIFEPTDDEKEEDSAKIMDARTRRTVIEPLTPIEPTENTEATLPDAETDPREHLNQPDLDASFGDISEADLPVELFVDEPELITDEDQPVEKETEPVDEEPLTPGDIDAQIMALESDDAAARQATIPLAGDIPKQYAEHTIEGPEPSAVFDAASEAPEPLQHAEKKKSGLAVVLWILLLIIIGAGGGVAVWYFLLQ